MTRLLASLVITAILCSYHNSIAQGELWGTTRTGGVGNNGTIFKINCDATSHTVVYSFTDPIKGALPHGSLVSHSNGKFYGLTRNGGASGVGALFEFNPGTSTYTKKIDLNETIGYNAFGTMVEAVNGRFYGTISNGGGSSSVGVFFEYNPANNQYVVIRALAGTSYGANPMGTPMVASNGKIYGTTANGGVNNHGVLFEYDLTTQTFTKKVDFNNTGQTSAGAGPYGTLLEIFPGKLYGTTGGNSENGSLYEYDIATNTITPKYIFPLSDVNGSLIKEGLTMAANGKVYGMTSAGGLNDHGVIFEYDPTSGTFAKKMDLTSQGLATPRGAFTELANGKLYGTVSTTPTGGLGAWFEYDPATNTITNKVFFQGTDGSNPEFVKLLHTPAINFYPIPAKTYGAAPFTINATSTGGTGITFTSSDPAVASISSQTVTIHKAGITRITASMPGTCPGEVVTAHQFLTVNKINLTATAAAKSKSYGQPNPALTFTYSGFVGGETATVLNTPPGITTVATATSNVGSYAITLSGGSDDSYSFTFVNASLTITKAPLTITADNKTKTYGDVNPPLSLTYNGFVGTETQTVLDNQPVLGTVATTGSNVGPYAITVSGATDNNYALTHVNGVLNIQKRLLTVTAANKTRQYGLANPPLTFTYSGFLASENESYLDQLPTTSTLATTESNAGEYDIILTPGVDVNYSFQNNPAKLTITKAPLTVKADNAARTYGDANPQFTLSYVGFIGDDDLDDINQLPTPNTTAGQPTAVGEHDITVTGGSDNNYSFTYKPGKLVIGKAVVAVKPDDKSRVYGAADPSFAVTCQGLKNGETSSVIDQTPVVVSNASITSHPGSFKLIASGATDNNYDFLYFEGNLSIVKATLAVSGNDATRGYGQTNPVLGLSIAGFVNGDNKNDLDKLPVAYTSADSHSPVGEYEISSFGGLDNDYEFNYNDGVLTILKANQEVIFEVISDRILGETPFNLLGSATSSLPVVFSSASPKIKIENTKVTMLSAGRATVRASQPGNQNYLEAESEENSFCINPPKPAITITNVNSIAPVLKSSSEAGNQWYLNNVLIEGATGQTFTSSLSGGYSVQVTSDDCASQLSELSIIVITGDINEENIVTSYPNPVEDVLYVQGLGGDVRFSVADISGRVQEVNSTKVDERHMIDVRALSPGFYLVHFRSESITSYLKFLKK